VKGQGVARIFPWLGLLLLLLLPPLLDTYFLYLLTLFASYVIGAAGLHLLMGLTGQISLAQAAFVGIGAYGTTLFMTGVGLPFWGSLPLAAGLAALASLVIGLPALRVKGHYLALATLGFGQIVQLIFVHWDSVTNGPRGLKVPRPALGGYVLSEVAFAYVTLAITVLLLLAAANLGRAKIGRALMAIRDNDLVAQAMGVNLARYKLLAFALSAFYGAVAGGLYAALLGFIDPLGFTLWESVQFLTMLVLGGMGSLSGVVIGAVLLSGLPELLRWLKEYKELFFSLILLGCFVFMPYGIRSALNALAYRFGRVRTS
jgi:branched-chain amino acid transport system permease protein